MMGLIGRKIGVTSIFTENGNFISVTVIEILENRVTQIKSLTNDGYFAIQVTTGVKKSSRVTKSEAGHFAKAGVAAGRRLWEFRLSKNENFSVGQSINIDFFSKINKVDITGISKGKGFAGTVKRWNFRTQDSTHGNSLSHRAPGSTGQNQTPGRVFKGKKMAGQLGKKRVTIQNLSIVRVDTHHNFLLVHGVVPGAVNSDLMIKLAVKK